MFIEKSFFRIFASCPPTCIVYSIPSLVIRDTVTLLVNKQDLKLQLKSKIRQGVEYVTYAAFATPLFSVEMNAVDEGEFEVWVEEDRLYNQVDIADLTIEAIIYSLMEKAALEEKCLYL